MRRMKSGKVPCPDHISVRVWREGRGVFHQYSTKLWIPEEWRRSLWATFKSKGHVQSCSRLHGDETYDPCHHVMGKGC